MSLSYMNISLDQIDKLILFEVKSLSELAQSLLNILTYFEY